MSTGKLAVKLRLSPESYTAIYNLHPGYGEVQRVVRELVEAYLSARQATASEVDALAAAVLGRLRK